MSWKLYDGIEMSPFDNLSIIVHVEKNADRQGPGLVISILEVVSGLTPGLQGSDGQTAPLVLVVSCLGNNNPQVTGKMIEETRTLSCTPPTTCLLASHGRSAWRQQRLWARYADAGGPHPASCYYAVLSPGPCCNTSAGEGDSGEFS